MKYRLTPGNAFFLFFMGIFIYYRTNPASAIDKFGASYIFFFAVFILLGDFFLQLFITNYKKLLLVELIGLPMIILLTLLA